MSYLKGTVVNVYDFKLVEGCDMEAPELMQVIVGETICNFFPEIDFGDSDGSDIIEYVVELDDIIRELEEYMSNNYPYILSYEWMISSYIA